MERTSWHIWELLNVGWQVDDTFGLLEALAGATSVRTRAQPRASTTWCLPRSHTGAADVPPGAASSLRVTLAHRYSGVDRGRWSAAVEPTVYLSPSWFASVEGKLAPTARYVIVEDDCGAAAGAFYSTGGNAYRFYNPLALLASSATLDLVRPFQSAAEAQQASSLTARIGPPLAAAVCTSPFGYTQPIRRTASNAQASAIRDALLAAADEWGAPVAACLYAGADNVVLRQVL